MSNGKVALAVGAGYLLGRTKKMKWALGLASAGLTGKFPSHPTDLVAKTRLAGKGGATRSTRSGIRPVDVRKSRIPHLLRDVRRERPPTSSVQAY